MGMQMVVEGVAIGESAKAHFSRSIFNVGGTGEEWKSNELFDFYASCARVGLMCAGHRIHGRARLRADAEVEIRGVALPEGQLLE
jgi:hypothetical protein